MRANIICGILLALTVITTATAADTDSANYMLPACKEFMSDTPSASFEAGMCAGTVVTIAHMAMNSDLAVTAFSGEGQIQAIKNHWRCADIPGEVTRGQLVRVVIQYIEARPKRMHEPFRSLALRQYLTLGHVATNTKSQ
jgi:hypothetical protein